MSLASVQLVESTCEAVLDHLLLSLLLSLLVLITSTSLTTRQCLSKLTLLSLLTHFSKDALGQRLTHPREDGRCVMAEG